MTKKLKASLIGILTVLMCFAFAFGLLFGISPVRPSAEDAETVTLSDASDFVITDGVLSGLSEAGNGKIADVEAYSIVVPDGVTEISEGAFAGLGGLTSLTVPFVGKNATATGAEGVLGYMFGKIGYVGASLTYQVYNSKETPNQTFDPDTYNLNCIYGDTYAGYIPKKLSEVTVTGGTISHGAFSYCNNLKKVTLQNIDTVGDLAFFEANVSEVNLGDVTVINRRAFQRTHYLREIDLNSVTRIGRFAFAESGLYKVELPTCLGENLEQYAFYNCIYLSSLKVNPGVKVSKVLFSGTNRSQFESSPRIVEVIDLREGEDVDKSVGFWAGTYSIVQDYMTVSEEASAPSNIFNVDGYIFKKTATDCIFISYIGEDKHLNLPDAAALEDYGVTSYKIINEAFNYNDRNFITAYIPSCVTEIGDSAFLDSGLVKITIGEEREDGVYPEIKYTPNATFWGCNSLKEVFIFSSLDENPMFGYTEYIYDSDANAWDTEFITLQGVHLYNAAKGGEVPESRVQVIGDYLFYESGDSIELVSYNGTDSTISLPDKEAVKAAYPDSDGSYKIGINVFTDNAYITGVSIPEAVTEIGEFAFNGCNTLVNVNIAGNALTKIGAEAFNQCSALAAITIPDSVEHIGTAAFQYCTSLTSVSLPVSLKTWGTEKLLGGGDTDTGYIFFSCTNLTSVTIPAGVTEIPRMSFYNCSSLVSLTFAEGSHVETIGVNAFSGTALTSVVLPASVKTIDMLAFGDTIKQVYLEEGSQLTTLDNVFMAARVRFISVNIANASSIACSVDTKYSFESGSTAFLPAGVSEKVLIQFSNATTIVVPDKATYDAIQASTNTKITAAIKAKVYWQTQVEFSVTDKLGNTYTLKQDKLASTAGASIKYVLTHDEDGHPYGYAVDNNYALPSRIGSNVVDATKWVDGEGNAVTVDATIASNGIVYSMTGVDAIIAAPADVRIEYTGEEFELDDANLVYVRTTDLLGNDATATEVGTYRIYVKPVDGAVWESGDTAEKYFTLEIYKATVDLVWYFNINNQIYVVGDKSDIYEQTYFDGLDVALFTAKYGDITLTTAVGGGIAAIKDGDTSTNISLMDEGLYKLTASHKNYEFNNPTLYIRVNPIMVNLGNTDVFGWTVNNDELGSGSVHIYNDGSNDIIHSLIHPGVAYTDHRTVTKSIARYTGNNITVEFSRHVSFDSPLYGNNTQLGAGVYVSTANLIAKTNYRFETALVNSLAEYGMTVTLGADGKTAIVTKTWYIVEIDNELLNSAASIEKGDWVLYGISDWTFGDTVSISLPRLAHGDEANNWANSTGKVTFKLYRNNTEIEPDVTKNRSVLTEYVNGTMPIGSYRLVFNVNFSLDGGEHAHWWDDAEHDSTSMGTVFQDFEREYSFNVLPATIVLDAVADKTGYANYTWELNKDDKSGFFAEFEEYITDKIKLTKVTPSAKWESYDYGNYQFTYNFARMNSGEYLAASNNNLTNLINGGTEGTYTVFFRIGADNHEVLGNDNRYIYFFTVTVYETLDIPVVSDAGLIYTSNKVLPKLDESDLYEAVWSENDAYIAGGEHSVSFRLYDTEHYRWKDESGDTVSVKFTIAKAENVFTVSLNMLGWNYETFDAAVNNIRAAVRFLDDGQSIHFRVTKKGQTTALSGLGDFGIDEKGEVNATVAGLLNSLKTGEYTLYAKVNGTNNYYELELDVTFVVDKSINTWADGEDDLVLPSWIVGMYDAEENVIAVNAAHGVVNIIVTDLDGNEYYKRINGVVELDNLNDCEIGKYLLKAWVDESDDYFALAERTFTIEVFKKAGLPWWAALLITVGALGVAALILWILHEKGILQMLTDKVVIAIRTKMTVDATIAAVRANRRAEEAKKSIAKAEAQDRLEAMRKKAAEQRALPPEERAAALEEKAAAEAARAEKSQQRAEKLQKRATRLKGKTGADAAETPDESPETPEAETETPEAIEAETPEAVEAETPEAVEAETPEAETTETAETEVPETETAEAEVAAADNTNTTDEE